MRLIDVDALRADYGMAEDCKNCKTGYRSCEYDRIYSKMDFCGWLDDAPTVDAVPVVHGEWQEENCRPRSSIFYCSICHRTAYDIQPSRDKAWKKRCRYAYCPNCGARMDGEDDGDE